jgi:cytochrome b6
MSDTSAKDWIKQLIREKKGKPIPTHVNFFYCFGGISLFLIAVQLATGVGMLFFYTADPKTAYDSVLEMATKVPFGWLLRDMHRWGSTLVLATIFSHMIIVFYLKAYQSPRQYTWMSGVFQLLMVFLMLVTGLLLPWNWRSYWSFAIWMDYVKSWTIGGETLNNLFLDTFTINMAYYTHILIIPLILALVLSFHFKMVKRHGITGPL